MISKYIIINVTKIIKSVMCIINTIYLNCYHFNGVKKRLLIINYVNNDMKY